MPFLSETDSAFKLIALSASETPPTKSIAAQDSIVGEVCLVISHVVMIRNACRERRSI